MLAALGVRSIRLMTNNPNKVAQLARYGVKVAGRMPQHPARVSTTATTLRPRHVGQATSSSGWMRERSEAHWDG